MSASSHRAIEMKALSPRLARKRGQSLAEMAVVIPVLVFLLMGGFDASVMISNKITAGSAVRPGPRLAARGRRAAAAEAAGRAGDRAAGTDGHAPDRRRRHRRRPRGWLYVQHRRRAGGGGGRAFGRGLHARPVLAGVGDPAWLAQRCHGP